VDVTTWIVQVRWGNHRLHTEALDREGMTSLELGPAELGIDGKAAFTWTELGLKVALSPGFSGRALECAKDRGDAFELFLEPKDTLKLGAGSLRIDVRPAFLPARRLPIDVKVLGVLALALFGVALVLASVVGA
jgi:hypothetical protein